MAANCLTLLVLFPATACQIAANNALNRQDFGLLDQHTPSGKLLRMELPYTKENLTEATLELIRKQNFRENVYIRPLAFYGDEIIGVRLHNLTPRMSIAAVPFGRYIEQEEGAHVTISSWWRVEDNMIPARGKIVEDALQVRRRFAGFDEPVHVGQ